MQRASNIVLRGIGLLPTKWIKVAASLQWRHPLAKRAFELVANRMRNRDETIQQGAGKGLRFNAASSTAGMVLGTTEPELQRAFEVFVKRGMTVYDVGANVGFFSVIAAKLVGSEGLIVAFDPLPSNIAAVAHNAELNEFGQIACEEVALGRSDGIAEFLMSADPNWGRLASLGKPGDASGNQEVKLCKVDSLVASGLRAPDAIKIDVEGAEVDVLEGALRTLRSARPLLFIDLHGTNAKVARILEDLEYAALVSAGERGKSIVEARWDVQIIAVPREDGALVSALKAFVASLN